MSTSDFDDPYREPASVAQPVVPLRLPHSGLGIASFILALVLSVVLFVTFIIAGVLQATTPGGIDPNAPRTALLGMLMLAALAGQLLALVLGGAGLFQQQRNKLFAILGVLISILVLAGTVGLIVIGSMLGAP